MAGRYQAYQEYVDSGIEWLGMIPCHWKLNRYKYALKLIQGAAFKSGEYVADSDVINIRMGNIKKGGYIDLFHNTKFLPNEFKSSYSQYELKEGDLVIAMTDMSPSLDFLAIPAMMKGLDRNKTYLLNQRVGKLAVERSFSINYLKYLLLSNELRSQLKEQGLGTVQSNMSSENLYNSFFVAPKVEEQTQITNFLDHETAKIDTLIEKQQQLIKLLKEKRQAVISHAVTKGLNPDAPMRDSGVEWLGEVPEHWEVVMIGKKIQLQRGVDITKDEQTEGEIPVVSSGGISSYHNRSTCIGPGVVVGRKGTAGKLHYVESDFWAHDTTLYVKEFHGNNIRYVYYKLISMKLENYDTGSANPTLNRNNVHPVKVSWPPLEEQQKIVKYLDLFHLHANRVTESINNAIELLHERRTALISAAVTGKIDVRNWQPV